MALFGSWTSMAGMNTVSDLQLGSGLTPVQATQVGLVWCLARRAVALYSGMSEADFQDCWQGRMAPPQAPQCGGSGVKERVLKMSSLIDQADDSELLPPTLDQVGLWTGNYIAIMGAVPEESEKPSASQLAALNDRLRSWGPYERKLSNGSYLEKELAGPPILPSMESGLERLPHGLPDAEHRVPGVPRELRPGDREAGAPVACLLGLNLRGRRCGPCGARRSCGDSLRTRPGRGVASSTSW